MVTARVTGHQTGDESMAYASNLGGLPGFRYAAAFHMGPDQLEFDAEATASRPVLTSGEIVGEGPRYRSHRAAGRRRVSVGQYP